MTTSQTLVSAPAEGDAATLSKELVRLADILRDCDRLVSTSDLAEKVMRDAAASQAQPKGMGELSEHFDELKATLDGAHSIMESLSAIERRVGPVGSHARGYTHKITKALRHLAELRSALAPSPAPAPAMVAERINSAALKRAMGHPIVLEIMADCVSCADTENHAMSDPEFAVHDSAPYRLVEADLRCQAAAIRAQDPDIWPTLEFDKPQAIQAPAVGADHAPVMKQALEALEWTDGGHKERAAIAALRTALETLEAAPLVVEHVLPFSKVCNCTQCESVRAAKSAAATLRSALSQ